MAGKSLKNKLVFRDSDNDDNGDDSGDKVDSGSDCGLSLEKLNLGPRRKLLVFSLNGLLLHRAHCSNKSEIPTGRTPDGRYGSRLVFQRPFAEEFMRFCLERFEVGIWSSAQEKNVDGILDCIMEKLRNRLLFVWDQCECTDSGFKSLEKRAKPLFFKELRKVWDNFGGNYSESDTVLIDDKPYKALLNPTCTGIFLESYEADNDSDNALDPKGELGEYLDGLSAAKDVQIYVKDNPFGQPAISPDHHEWHFYSTVLRRLGKQLKP